MQFRTAPWLMAGLLLAATAPPVGAQEEVRDPARAQEELRSLEKRLENVAGRKVELEAAIEDLVQETEALSRKLVATASKIQALEAEISAGEERLLKLADEQLRLRTELAARHDQLAELLAGLQRLEKDPPPPLAVNPQDALAALRGAMLLGSVVPELRARAGELVLKLARMSEIRQTIEREQVGLRENLDALDIVKREVGHLLEQKQTLTQTIRGALEGERRKVQALALKARSLKDLIGRIELARAAAEEAREAAEQAEAVEKERRRKIELARLMKPAIRFSKARGTLYYPVQGERVRDYGGDDGLDGEAEGLSIATRKFAQVTAPADGWVAYSGEFRGYGQLLIINAGEGYHVLLAGMKKIAVDVGQFVRAGEPVGTMGAEAIKSTVIDIQAESSKPILYVEFRKNGNAIDPRPWWAGNDEKVRG